MSGASMPVAVLAWKAVAKGALLGFAKVASARRWSSTTFRFCKQTASAGPRCRARRWSIATANRCGMPKENRASRPF